MWNSYAYRKNCCEADLKTFKNIQVLQWKWWEEKYFIWVHFVYLLYHKYTYLWHFCISVVVSNSCCYLQFNRLTEFITPNMLAWSAQTMNFNSIVYNNNKMHSLDLLPIVTMLLKWQLNKHIVSTLMNSIILRMCVEGFEDNWLNVPQVY